MKGKDSKISLLDLRSRAKLVSSARVSSLNEVVVELIKNALDAGARSTEVTLNYATGYCSVIDNGCGIPAREFSVDGKLAKEYCTSKTTASKQIYGRHGQTLSRIAGVALLCVVSKASEYDGAHVQWYDEAGRIPGDSQCNEGVQTSIGTTVRVYNLFAKMPVRSKHIGQVFANDHEVRKEFNRLKHSVLGLVLSSDTAIGVDVKCSSPALRYHHRPTAVRSIPNVQPFRSSEAICSGLRQAGYGHEQKEAEWRSIAVRSGSISGFAMISMIPIPHRDLQFISIDCKDLAKDTRPDIFAHVNALFSASSFGTSEIDSHLHGDLADCDRERKCYHGMKQWSRLKRIDQWPMFVIWLEDNEGIGLSDVLQAKLITSASESHVHRVTGFLEFLLCEFLAENGFSITPKTVQKPRKDHVDSENQLNQVRDHINQAVEDNFSHFSRLRSSAFAGNNEILEGLPFSHTRGEQHARLAASGVEEAMETNAVGIPSTQNEDFSMTLPWNDNEDQYMLWLDPATGRYANIDLRTGMVLSNSAMSQRKQSSEVETPQSGHMQSGARHSISDRSITQTARNIHKYFDTKSESYNAPIPAIMLQTDSVEGFRHEENFALARVHQIGSASYSADRPVRVTKEALENVGFSAQVDKKFILATVPLQAASKVERGDDLLILIDQHAADERCKVEELLTSVRRGVSVHLQEPIRFELPHAEINRLAEIQPVLNKLCFTVEVTTSALAGSSAVSMTDDNQLRQVELKALPEAIAERCRSSPRLAIEILRELIWLGHTRKATASSHANLDALRQASLPLSIISELPQRMLDLINSRACRSAVMFNDELDSRQCQDLTRQLSKCMLPFQCAHGRPSMIVVAGVQQVADYFDCGYLINAATFGEAYRAWTGNTSR